MCRLTLVLESFVVSFIELFIGEHWEIFPIYFVYPGTSSSQFTTLRGLIVQYLLAVSHGPKVRKGNWGEHWEVSWTLEVKDTSPILIIDLQTPLGISEQARFDPWVSIGAILVNYLGTLKVNIGNYLGTFRVPR
jgi:hypothetical protein